VLLAFKATLVLMELQALPAQESPEPQAFKALLALRVLLEPQDQPAHQ
jgi:hypothetical protein